MRTSPPILATSLDDELELIRPPSMYAVCWRGEPIHVRRIIGQRPAYKYAKTVFPTLGHAQRAALNLNIAFNTWDFTVAECSVTVSRMIPRLTDK
jgi:hypothetical protein